jgi:hypothetical protein
MKISIQKRGSIALISLLIISAFTLLIVLAASEASVLTYERYLNESSGETTYYGAESCLEEAIIRLESDVNFAGGTLTIDDDTTCTTTVTGTTDKTISISVDFLDYTQNYEAVVRFVQNGSIYNSELISWQEIRN